MASSKEAGMSQTPGADESGVASSAPSTGVGEAGPASSLARIACSDMLKHGSACLCISGVGRRTHSSWGGGSCAVVGGRVSPGPLALPHLGGVVLRNRSANA